MPARMLRHAVSAAAPILCAVHCVLTPFLVAVVPALGGSPAVEYTLFATSMLLATWALHGGTRVHGDPRPAIVAVLGLATWCGLLTGIVPSGSTEWPLAVAALLTAAGLLWNARQRHLAASLPCSCAACGHVTD